MSEFKFACPKCRGDIVYDTIYAGRQINCPICQQLIVVPQGAAKAGGGAMKKVLVAVGVLVVLGALGAGGWYFYSKHKDAVTSAAGNPAAQVAAPSSQSVASALAVTEKMHLAYSSLNTLSAKGTAVIVLDMTGITAADMNPKSKNKNTKQRPAAGVPAPMTMKSDVSMKLSKPDKFLVEGTMRQAMGPVTMTNTTATWSTGETNFSLMLMNSGSYKNFTTVSDRNQALMMNGQGGALALGVPLLFFDDMGTMSKFISDWGQTGEEAVEGEDCVMLTGKLLGQKLNIWVSKTSYLILKSEITLGGAISDADMDAMLSLNTNKNMTPAQVAQMKAQAKQGMAMMTKVKGTITESYSYETNNTFSANDFDYPVPRGVKLAKGM